MTKEELKQEAEECAEKFFGKPTDLVDLDNLRIFKNGYLASAESREKQIQIDAKQIRALQKQNGELTDKVKELEAQIEKMKSDVTDEIGIAGGFNELHTYSVLNNLLNRWEMKE